MTKSVKRRINSFAALLGISLLCMQRPALPSTLDFLKTSKVAPGEVVRLVPDGKHPQWANYSVFLPGGSRYLREIDD
jgi:hypothetical protein